MYAILNDVTPNRATVVAVLDADELTDRLDTIGGDEVVAITDAAVGDRVWLSSVALIADIGAHLAGA